jgi:immune inhibitor A
MRRNAAVVIVVVGLLACCCCMVLSLGGYLVYEAGPSVSTQFAPLLTDVFATGTPTPKPAIVLTPPPTPFPGAGDTLNILQSSVIPERDLRQLAMSLQGIASIPETVSDTPADHAVGDTLEFNVTNPTNDQSSQVTARLIYITDNVYFFADTAVRVKEDQVKNLVDNFQKNIYPTDRQFFGSEWTPGVDGDPHLYILYTYGLGGPEGGAITFGYFSSADEYSHLAHPRSNEKEMFYLNANATDVGDPVWNSILAHEFQHMIHWRHDRNEETWMNEGASDLAELLNGYDVGGHDDAFIRDPDLQLNAWSEGGPGAGSIPHYGAAFLFMAYFLDRFGNEATQALVADPANGLTAVDDVLASRGITDTAHEPPDAAHEPPDAAHEPPDAATGRPIAAVDVFADWVIANTLGDPKVADGRYAYHDYPKAPRISSPTDTLTCPATQAATVHQFAADYYALNCDGSVTITFTGSQQVGVIPATPHSGRYAFWGHRNDDSDTTLTRAFDLGGVRSATLTYWAWWAIEENYDFTYLEVSTDGGQTWTIVHTPSGTGNNQTGNNLGWGYTGNSGGGGTSEWVNETVDLSAYAGQKIQIRFEYVTDDAVTRPGFMVDDVSIPELGHTADFESDDGGWEGAGFVRMDNVLPQKFVVQVIRQGRTSAETTVERMPLDVQEQGRLTLDLQSGEKAVLVVSGVTPFTTEVASYQFEIK